MTLLSVDDAITVELTFDIVMLPIVLVECMFDDGAVDVA